MQKNRDVIEHCLEEQGQFVTPRIKHLFSNAIQSRSAAAEILRVPHFFCRGTSRISIMNFKGKLHSIYSKDFNVVLSRLVARRNPLSLSYKQNASSNFPSCE